MFMSNQNNVVSMGSNHGTNKSPYNDPEPHGYANGPQPYTNNPNIAGNNAYGPQGYVNPAGKHLPPSNDDGYPAEGERWAAQWFASVNFSKYTHPELIDVLKLYQRRDPELKTCWSHYTAVNGTGIRDPAKHTQQFITVFLQGMQRGELAEYLVMKNPHRGEEANEVFVGALSGMSLEIVRDYFAQFGKLRYVDVRNERGYAFVKFESKGGMEACMERKEHTIKGKKIEVKPAENRQPKAHRTSSRSSSQISRPSRGSSQYASANGQADLMANHLTKANSNRNPPSPFLSRDSGRPRDSAAERGSYNVNERFSYGSMGGYPGSPSGSPPMGPLSPVSGAYGKGGMMKAVSGMDAAPGMEGYNMGYQKQIKPYSYGDGGDHDGAGYYDGALPASYTGRRGYNANGYNATGYNANGYYNAHGYDASGYVIPRYYGDRGAYADYTTPKVHGHNAYQAASYADPHNQNGYTAVNYGRISDGFGVTAGGYGRGYGTVVRPYNVGAHAYAASGSGSYPSGKLKYIAAGSAYAGYYSGMSNVDSASTAVLSTGLNSSTGNNSNGLMSNRTSVATDINAHAPEFIPGAKTHKINEAPVKEEEKPETPEQRKAKALQYM